MRRSGFTIVEMLIVIAIIGILAVLVPNLLSTRKRAYNAEALACAKQITTAQEAHQIDNKTYANTMESLDSSLLNLCDTTKMDVSLGGADSTTYSATVSHRQGTKTWVVTPDGIR